MLKKTPILLFASSAVLSACIPGVGGGGNSYNKFALPDDLKVEDSSTIEGVWLVSSHETESFDFSVEGEGYSGSGNGKGQGLAMVIITKNETPKSLPSYGALADSGFYMEYCDDGDSYPLNNDNSYYDSYSYSSEGEGGSGSIAINFNNNNQLLIEEKDSYTYSYLDEDYTEAEGYTMRGIKIAEGSDFISLNDAMIKLNEIAIEGDYATTPTALAANCFSVEENSYSYQEAEGSISYKSNQSTQDVVLLGDNENNDDILIEAEGYKSSYSYNDGEITEGETCFRSEVTVDYYSPSDEGGWDVDFVNYDADCSSEPEFAGDLNFKNSSFVANVNGDDGDELLDMEVEFNYDNFVAPSEE